MYTLSANQGLADAQYKLGAMYAKGRGVKKSFKYAVEWYTLAAVQGHAKAQHNLGLMYAAGKGAKKSFKRAAKWTQKAAAQGNKEAKTSLKSLFRDIEASMAQYNLANEYYSGNGVKQDYKRAVELFTLVADQGDAKSQYNLGLMYVRGQGVDKDNKRAAEWFTLAADQGDANAIRALKDMKDKDELFNRQRKSDDIETETEKMLKDVGELILKYSKNGDLVNLKIVTKTFGRNPQLLWAEKRYLEYKSKKGYTSLIYAAAKGHFYVVKYLISKGADVKAKDNNGVSVLDYAIKLKKKKKYKQLINDALTNAGATQPVQVDHSDFGVKYDNAVKALKDREDEEVRLTEMIMQMVTNPKPQQITKNQTVTVNLL